MSASCNTGEGWRGVFMVSYRCVPSLLACDKRSWPRCLLWHGWLLVLAPLTVGSPWAAAFSDSVAAAFGVCARMLFRWLPGWDWEDIAVMSDVPGQPNLWTDGRDEDHHVQVGIVGAWCLLFLWCLGCLIAEPWGTLKARIWRRMLPGFFPRSMAPYVRFIVRSTWVILALRTLMPLHLEIDNKNVCHKVCRLPGRQGSAPFCFCADGDLLACDFWHAQV